MDVTTTNLGKILSLVCLAQNLNELTDITQSFTEKIVAVENGVPSVNGTLHLGGFRSTVASLVVTI